MSADGTDIRAHTADLGAGSPAWSPDGRSLVFSGAVGDPAGDVSHDLFTLELAAPAAAPRVVAHGTGSLTLLLNPDWFEAGVRLPAPDIRDSLAPMVRLLGSRDGLSAGRAVSAARTLRGSRRSLRFFAIDRTGISNVAVAVAKRAGGRCRHVDRRGRLGPATACANARFLTVRGQRDFGRLVKRLRRGAYELRFRTRDVRGNQRASRQPIKVVLTS
jgi:WD40-like Beta Propeller Repeat